MQRTRLLQNGATAEESGVLLVAGDYSPHAFSQGHGAPIQTVRSKIRAHAQALKQNRPARFGLPCANCKAYYASDLPACPICKCAERVQAEEAEAKSTNRLKEPSAGALRTLGSCVDLDPTPRASRRCSSPCTVTKMGSAFYWNPSCCFVPTPMKPMLAILRSASWMRITTLVLNTRRYA